MGQSSPSAHEPQRSALQLEDASELLNRTHGLGEAVGEGAGHLPELVPRFFVRAFCIGPVGVREHRSGSIEARTEVAGWLVLRGPTSVNLR